MNASPQRRFGLAIVLSVLAAAGCTEERAREMPPLVFGDVEPILQESCVECHGGEEPEAGYSVEGYFETIRCIPDPDGQPATLPPDEAAPILAVLEEESHADLLEAPETETLTAWVAQGAVPNSRSTHPGAWNDPRSESWHGIYLRETEWQPIVDPTREDACGLCHAGSPAPVEGVFRFPPGATDCTDCHTEPGGVMACSTCHGEGDRPYPPRDQCYFRGPPEGFAHESHDEPSANNPSGLGCQACHFGVDFAMLGPDGLHANGMVDVVFQPAWGPDAMYDFDTRGCATTCHARGGTTPEVAWDEGELDLQCNACHENPPTGHTNIACNSCHRGINAEGTMLTDDAPHINGRVDVF